MRAASRPSIWTCRSRLGVRGAHRPIKVDLCQDDYDRLIQPILDLLASARPYPKGMSRHRQWKGRDVGPFLCLECNNPPLKHAGTLTAHVQQQHAMTRAEYIKKHGPLVPLTPEEVAELVVEVTCGIGGCEQLYSTELGNRWPHQAMRAHQIARHGTLLHDSVVSG